MTWNSLHNPGQDAKRPYTTVVYNLVQYKTVRSMPPQCTYVRGVQFARQPEIPELGPGTLILQANVSNLSLCAPQPFSVLVSHRGILCA